MPENFEIGEIDVTIRAGNCWRILHTAVVLIAFLFFLSGRRYMLGHARISGGLVLLLVVEGHGFAVGGSHVAPQLLRHLRPVARCLIGGSEVVVRYILHHLQGARWLLSIANAGLNHVDGPGLLSPFRGLLHPLVVYRTHFVLFNGAEALLRDTVLGHFCFLNAIRRDRATRLKVEIEGVRGVLVCRVTLPAHLVGDEVV